MTVIEGKSQQATASYARCNADLAPPGFVLGATFSITAIARRIALAAAAIASASSSVRP
jgi:hypothetical protein